MFSGLVIATAIFFSGIASSGTGDSQPPDLLVNMIFGHFGFHAAPPVSPNKCIVHMTLNQKMFLHNFARIKKIWLLNQSLDNSEVFKQPNTLSMAFLFQIMPPATKNLYEGNENADSCLFEQSIIIC